jgi:hypothetical protein
VESTGIFQGVAAFASELGDRVALRLIGQPR